jgi:hypothetical protein
LPSAPSAVCGKKPDRQQLTGGHRSADGEEAKADNVITFCYCSWLLAKDSRRQGCRIGVSGEDVGWLPRETLSYKTDNYLVNRRREHDLDD